MSTPADMLRNWDRSKWITMDGKPTLSVDVGGSGKLPPQDAPLSPEQQALVERLKWLLRYQAMPVVEGYDDDPGAPDDEEEDP